MKENNAVLTDITPNVRLLRVLRNSGFSLQTAMAELLDNSVDAGANEIDVYTYMNDRNMKNIMVVDNGKGMNEDTIKQSLTLAKELKLGINELGKFGMGMKTAALSISTQFEIYTKTMSGKIIYAEFNINKMEQLGKYKTTVRLATKEEENFFNTRPGKRRRSGTILIVKNCDRFDIGFNTFVKQMETYIGLTYKSFIEKGVKFTVNDLPVKGKEIPTIDPLMREHDSTYVVADRLSFPVQYVGINGKVQNSGIQVTAVVLPKLERAEYGRFSANRTYNLPINQMNQGIYFYREGRMVGQAMCWNNLFGVRHPSKNRFRIEIHCKSEIDDEIKMNFQKGNVSPTTGLKMQLAEIIEPLMAEMRERIRWEEEGENVSLTTNSETNFSLTELVLEKPLNEEQKENNLDTIERKQKRMQFTVSQKNTTKNYEKLIQEAAKIGLTLNDNDVPEVVKDLILEALGIKVEQKIVVNN